MTVAPGELASSIDQSDLPPGTDERFVGYGIMAQPFDSGHVLALRRFPHNTIGSAYTSVWHCDPAGRWTMWNDAAPLESCPRYFGPALEAVNECAIALEWPDPWSIHVRIAGVLDWETTIASTLSTRVMTAVGAHVPASMWQRRAALSVMSWMAGATLHADKIRLHGVVPSRQWFRVRIPYVWSTSHVRAFMFGEDLGPAGRVNSQRWLGGFALPNRGLFAVGRVTLEGYDPQRHVRIAPTARAH